MECRTIIMIGCCGFVVVMIFNAIQQKYHANQTENYPDNFKPAIQQELNVSAIVFYGFEIIQKCLELIDKASSKIMNCVNISIHSAFDPRLPIVLK